MELRTLATATGAWITTFLTVGAVIVQAVGTEIVAGILGVLLGTTAGVLAAALVILRWSRLSGPRRWALDAYGAFGYAFVFLGMLGYVNAPGVRATLTVPLQVGVGVLVALVTFAVAWWRHTARRVA